MAKTIVVTFSSEGAKGFKEKLKCFWWSFKTKLIEFRDWVVSHIDVVIVLGPMLFGGICKILRMISTSKRTSNSTVYDPRLGMYYSLKRPMKNREVLEFESRRKAGEEYGEILEDMNLI